MLCPNCGAEHPGSAHFCPTCGTALREDAAQVRSAALIAAGLDPDTPATELTPVSADTAQLPFDPIPVSPSYSAAYAMPPVRKKRRRWQLPVLAALLLALLAVIAVTLLHSDVHDSCETVAEAYLECFEANDVSALYALLLPEAGSFIAEREQTDEAGVLMVLDDWFREYGTPIDDWTLIEASDMPDEQTQELAQLLNCPLAQWRAMYVLVDFADGNSAVLQIEAVESQGRWYLLEVYD